MTGPPEDEADVVGAADVVAIVPLRSDSTATSLTIHGRSIVGRTIEALRAVPRIRAIALALDGPPPDDLIQAIDGTDGPHGSRVLRSNPTRGRWPAILAALQLAPDSRSVLVQEPDRPLVSAAAITELLDRPIGPKGLVVASPVVSTIKRVVAGRVVGTVPRQDFHVEQGQRLFPRRAFEDALRRAVAEHWDAPTESELAGRAGIPLEIVAGQALDVPVSSQADARFAELAIERGLA